MAIVGAGLLAALLFGIIFGDTGNAAPWLFAGAVGTALLASAVIDAVIQ
jgi:hypothetical protein